MRLTKESNLVPELGGKSWVDYKGASQISDKQM